MLVQCFPVRPQHPVQVRLSLVCPLALSDKGLASLELPTVVDKNFPQVDPVKVSVDWNESGSAEPTHFSRAIDSSQLNEMKMFVQAKRDQNCEAVYCRDTFSQIPQLLQLKIEDEHFVRPSRLFVIVDGSASMHNCISEIVEGLKDLPSTLPLDLQIVGDETQTLCSGALGPSDPKFLSAMESLKKFDFIAGQDDSPALLSAVQKAMEIPGGAVLWIHGSQPVRRTCTLAQFLVGKKKKPFTFYDFSVADGPNEFLAGMYSSSNLIRVSRTNSTKSDLDSLWKAWTPQEGLNQTRGFTVIPDPESQTEFKTPEANSSMAQLYAYQQILEHISTLENLNSAESDATLASNYHLVTPVSSAVVADIDPNQEEEKIATAVSPEADTWILLIMVAGMFGYAIYLQAKQRAALRCSG